MLDPLDNVGFLFALFREGWVQFKPLAHGLHSLCREMIDNNFSRYQRVYDNLKVEIVEKQSQLGVIDDLQTYRENYYKSLVEAKSTIDFWCSLACMYYGVPKNALSTPRILTSSRKLVVSNKSRSRKGTTILNTLKNRIKVFESDSQVNGTKHSRLLAGDKVRCKRGKGSRRVG